MTSKPRVQKAHIVEQEASGIKVGSRDIDRPRKLIGLGRFDSGIPDLGSNKKHMEDFGQKSMGIRRKER
jgi:hypothetical protein